MANINGTNLAAPVVPFTTDDTYPTHYAMYGKGGHRSVQTITNRNAIPTSLKEEGMTVFVIDEGIKYTWKKNPNNGNVVEWMPDAAVNSVGNNTQVIFNDNRTLTGSVDFTYDKVNKIIKVGSWFKFPSDNSGGTGVGYNCLLNDVGVSTNNTGFGHECLSLVTAGTANAGFGFTTLQKNIGSANTAIGHYALKNNTTGNNNVSIGTSSGVDNNGNNNIFLGYASGRSYTNVSNKLAIDTNLQMIDADSHLITGDFSQRWVSFNGALRKRVVNITSTSSLNSGTATSATTNSVTDTAKTFTVNEFQNKFLIITGGVGVGQAMLITSNTTTTITTTKNFAVTPDNTSTYKIINGTVLLGEKLNSEYYFDLTTEDYVVVLTVISSSDFSGSSIDFCIKTNPSNKKLYVLTTSTNKILPDNVETTYIQTPYTVSSFVMSNVSWNKTIKNIQNLQPIKSSTKDLVIDLYSKIYKIDVATATTVTFNIASSYVPILTGNSLTIELDVNMTVVSAITWPVNVTWIGGTAPTFGSIAKYRIVFRTEDAGTTWIANLAYTY